MTTGARRRVAIVTASPLEPALPAVATRAVDLSRVIARHHAVRLCSTASDASRRDAVQRLAAWADVIVVVGLVPDELPLLVASGRAVVWDAVFEPFDLAWRAGHQVAAHLRAADVVLCASEVQRDFWLGQLASLGRVNPRIYDGDPALRAFVRVVPSGVPEDRPRRTNAALRGVVDGIGAGDRIVLWGGGFPPWADPELAVRAVSRLLHEVPSLRLVFLAGQDGAAAAPPVSTRDLAAELHLLGRHVFFVEVAVPHHERQNYLLDADVGVSASRDAVGSALTPVLGILDYCWAGLPVVVAGGAGEAVAAGDVDGFAAALASMLLDDERRAGAAARSAAMAAALQWSEVAQPLLDFCRDPRPAADRLRPDQPAHRDGPRIVTVARRTRALARLTREEGPGAAAKRVAEIVARRLRRS